MSQVCKITEPLCNITLQQEKNWAPEEVQGDYDYFMAQKAAELLLENKLISLSEFDKLTELNRKVDKLKADLELVLQKIKVIDESIKAEE